MADDETPAPGGPQTESALPEGKGESGGGPDPDPHGGSQSVGFKGGQSGAPGYYGHGRLGGQEVGDNDNAPADNDDC